MQPPARTNHAARRGALVTLVSAALLGMPNAGRAQGRTGLSFWAPIIGQGRLGSTWRLYLEMQPRYDNALADADRLLTRAAIGMQVTTKATLWAGYDWVPIFRPSLRHEHRTWQQFLLTTSSGRWTVTSRSRFEQRRLPNNQGTSHRAREQLRVTRPIGVTRRWSVALADELFVTLNEATAAVPRGFDRNRLFGGLGRSFGSALSMEGGYQWESINRPGNGRIRQHHIAVLSTTVRFGR